MSIAADEGASAELLKDLLATGFIRSWQKRRHISDSPATQCSCDTRGAD
jgi:hypothetical protein